LLLAIITYDQLTQIPDNFDVVKTVSAIMI